MTIECKNCKTTFSVESAGDLTTLKSIVCEGIMEPQVHCLYELDD